MTNYKEWKTAISTFDYDYGTLKRYADCGIKAIEISRSWDRQLDIDWTELKANADKAGIELWSCHLPFCFTVNPASLHHETAHTTVLIDSFIMEKAAAVGIKTFVIHPSSEPIEDEDREKSMEAAKIALHQLADTAERLGAVLCVEDLPRTCLGHDVKEMTELVESDSRLKVCFDVNHLCKKYGTTHKEFIDALGDKIYTLHISDYDFIDEKHFFPGMGKINWNELVTLLEQANYSGPFLYEGGFGPSHWAPEVPFGTFEDAYPRHMTIKELYGKE